MYVFKIVDNDMITLEYKINFFPLNNGANSPLKNHLYQHLVQNYRPYISHKKWNIGKKPECQNFVKQEDDRQVWNQIPPCGTHPDDA